MCCDGVTLGNTLPVQTLTCKHSELLSEMTGGEIQTPIHIQESVKNKRQSDTAEHRYVKVT